MSTTSTKFLFQLADPTDVFDNDKFLKGNFQLIESKVYSKTEIDAQIVRGTNANGEYIKFPNGTLICWKREIRTDMAAEVAYGSLFRGSHFWTFPASFVGDTPAVSVGEFRWGTSISWGTVGSADLGGATLYFLDVASRATGTSTYIGCMAVGRWK